MKIVIIGPGAMGLLFGAKLSTAANVLLIGKTPENIDAINEHGIIVKRNDEETVYPVRAGLGGADISDSNDAYADLIILFTKAYATEAALQQNKNLIGSNTYLLTLQNGAGHEDVLRKFADDNHILIGTTMQGSVRENAYTIVHTGLGDTTIGSVSGSFTVRECVSGIFEKAGIPLIISDNIRQAVWNKLVVNASSSVLSGVLNVPQGFIAENKYAWELCQQLVEEVCLAASADGCELDAKAQIQRVRNNLLQAPNGIPSITADLRSGRQTEVDTISGAVIRAAHKGGVKVPSHESIIRIVHALEAKIH